MKKIITTEAPPPAGHYSQAISNQGLVFVAGQLPLDPATGQMIEGGVEEQVKQTIQNIEAILLASNSDLNHVLKATIYIPDVSYWPEVNRVYAECFGDHKPARAVIPCGKLHYDAVIEMEVIARETIDD
ncbi:MAG TPA: Rid family detoxifying hydrolase [Saprospiraceae bacterium]|nr:Rid family detoxifying hydrolase [Saprospiraceae bacterium]